MTPEEFYKYLDKMPEPKPTGTSWNETSEIMVLQWDNGAYKTILVSRDFMEKRYA